MKTQTLLVGIGEELLVVERDLLRLDLADAVRQADGADWRKKHDSPKK